MTARNAATAALGISLLALLLYASTSLDRMAICAGGFSYYLLLAVFAVFVFQLGKRIVRDRPLRSLLWDARFALAASLLATGVMFLVIGPNIAILWDEANLLSIAQRFHHLREGMITDGVLWDRNHYQPVESSLAYRPFLFPLLVSALHSLTGYRVENAFILNFLVTFGTFFLIVRGFERILPRRRAVLVVLFLLATPLVCLISTTAAFGPLFVFWMILFIVMVENHVREQSPESLVLLWLTAVLYLSTRYEAGLLAAVVALGLLVARKIRFRDLLPHRVLYLIGAFAVLPPVWQRIYTRVGMPGWNQNQLHTVGLENLPGNLRAHEWMFDPAFELPMPVVLLCAPVLIVAAVVVVARVHGRRSRAFFIVALAAALVAVHTSVLALLPIPKDPTGHRLFLLLAYASALALFLLLGHVPRVRTAPVLAVIGLVLWLLYFPVATRKTYPLWQFDPRREEFVLAKLKELHPEYGPLTRSSLVILSGGERATRLTIEGYNAMTVRHVHDQEGLIEKWWKTRRFGSIYVAQEVASQSGWPLNESLLALPEYLILETVAEHGINDDKFVRLSRVVPRPEPEDGGFTPF